ncbi:PTS sugar transporter subunit IIA [candidate division KSB1 bacterium]|nr:PTS sugar transporter subunit IIA [candidate division KSB1 bacterium]
MVSVKELLDARYVTFLDCETKDECLNTLVDLVSQSENISDEPAFRKAVFERESIFSTGIGLGIALPHVKIPEVKDMTVAVGIHAKGVYWDSLDGEPVHIIFLIAGSSDQHRIYLQTVSKIVLVLKNAKRREQLIVAKSPEEIISLFHTV